MPRAGRIALVRTRAAVSAVIGWTIMKSGHAARWVGVVSRRDNVVPSSRAGPRP